MSTCCGSAKGRRMKLHGPAKRGTTPESSGWKSSMLMVDLRCSAHHRAAIGDDALPGDEARSRAGEIHRSAGDLLRLRNAAERNVGLLREGFGRGRLALQHGGVRRTG